MRAARILDWCALKLGDRPDCCRRAYLFWERLEIEPGTSEKTNDDERPWLLRARGGDAVMGALSPLPQMSIVHGEAAGPNSFAGLDWLAAVNLGFSTALSLIGLLFVGDLVSHLWRDRRKHRLDHPVTMFPLILPLLAAGIMLRKRAAAAVLWKWSADDPVGTSFALTLQRFIDPAADALQFAALALAILSARSLIAQLRRAGWAVPIWPSLPMLKRPAILFAMSMIATVGLVMMR